MADGGPSGRPVGFRPVLRYNPLLSYVIGDTIALYQTFTHPIEVEDEEKRLKRDDDEYSRFIFDRIFRSFKNDRPTGTKPILKISSTEAYDKINNMISKAVNDYENNVHPFEILRRSVKYFRKNFNTEFDEEIRDFFKEQVLLQLDTLGLDPTSWEDLDVSSPELRDVEGAPDYSDDEVFTEYATGGGGGGGGGGGRIRETEERDGGGGARSEEQLREDLIQRASRRIFESRGPTGFEDRIIFGREQPRE